MTNIALNLILETAASGSYHASLTDSADTVLAEHDFALPIDQIRQSGVLKRIEQGAISTTPGAGVADAEALGKQLYNAVFAGPVGVAFKQALADMETERSAMHLRLRIGVPELLNLPWEFLHDGERFVLPALNIFLSRVSADLKDISTSAVSPPIKILVIISNPLDLPESSQLDTDLEEETVVQALDALVRKGIVEVKYLEEATETEMRQALLADEFHVIHFVGHGNFDAKSGTGQLFVEDDDGNVRMMTNEQIANLWGACRTLRLVLLSSCLTAQTSSANVYGGTAQAILRKGVPAVIAMQYSVFEHSALKLWRDFYAALTAGKPIDEALASARRALSLTGTDQVDWATPTLYSRGAGDWRLTEPAPKTRSLGLPANVNINSSISYGGLEHRERGFVGRRKEIRQIRRGLINGGAHLALLHGFGGLGKTVLATKVADKLLQNGHLASVLVVVVRPDLKAEQVLKQFDDFFVRNGINNFSAVFQSNASIEQKSQILGQFLCQLPLLVIFDNAEDWLTDPDAETNIRRIADSDIAEMLKQLVNTVNQGSKFLITSRYEFDILPRGRGGGLVIRVPLGELSRIETLRLLGRLPGLKDTDWNKRLEVYDKVGGHPFTLNIFAERAADVGVDYVLADIRNVAKETIGHFLLEQIYSKNLSELARTLLARMSILRRSASKECLDALMGTHRIEPAIDELLRWGLMMRVQVDDELTETAEERYQMHAIVREFALDKVKDRLDILRISAEYYILRAEQTQYLDVTIFNRMEARYYYFAAKDYGVAAYLVNESTEYLIRWGIPSLAIELLSETLKTTEGHERAVTLHNLGTQLLLIGDPSSALSLYEQSLEIAKELGDKSGIAGNLHQMGMLEQDQGNLSSALSLYEQSLEIKKEIGDKKGIGPSLHEIARLKQSQGNLSSALSLYEQSLEIAKELGDKSGIAGNLHQMARLEQDQGNLFSALSLYEQSLEIAKELGDKSGIAGNLHQMARLEQDQGNLSSALSLYEQSLEIKKEIGDKRGIANTLLNMGALEQDQGNLSSALSLYEQSLEIKTELGDKRGIARNLHNMGNLEYLQNNWAFALSLYEQSLEIKKEIEDKSGIASSLAQIGNVQYQQDHFREAFQYLVQSWLLYIELNSPKASHLQNNILSIYEQVGSETFISWLTEDFTNISSQIMEFVNQQLTEEANS